MAYWAFQPLLPAAILSSPPPTTPPYAGRLTATVDDGSIDLRGLIRGAVLGTLVVVVAVLPIRIAPVTLADDDVLAGVVRRGIQVDTAVVTPIVPVRVTSSAVEELVLPGVMRLGFRVDPPPIVPVRIVSPEVVEVVLPGIVRLGFRVDPPPSVPVRSARVADDDELPGVVRRGIQVDVAVVTPIVTGRLTARLDDEESLRPSLRVGLVVAQVQPAPYVPDILTPVALANDEVPAGIVRRGIRVEVVVTPIVVGRLSARLAENDEPFGIVRRGIQLTFTIYPADTRHTHTVDAATLTTTTTISPHETLHSHTADGTVILGNAIPGKVELDLVSPGIDVRLIQPDTQIALIKVFTPLEVV